MPELVLLRHGQSQWNLENRFTGWVDVDLSPRGEDEARRSGELLLEAGIEFDQAFTSVLTRAIRTLWLALGACEQVWIPVEKDWRLNERHYGGLTGLNKVETAERHGSEQVHVWRRSYDIPPPPLEPGGLYDFTADRRYRGVIPPTTESLKTTLERVLPYWTSAVAPPLSAGRCVLIAAHGNSLRAIVKHLYGVPDADIPGVEIPTGNPLLIELDAQLRPVQSRYLDKGRASPLPELDPGLTMATAQDIAWMRRAIALARPRVGLTGSNPAVGCVIVKAGELIAEAATADGGRPHAEEQALAVAGESARGAVAYITLEPCGERSSGAPSCSELLIAAGVVWVVVACADPSAKASRRGLDRLSAAGVTVTEGVAEPEAGLLYADYRPAPPKAD